MSKTRKQSKRRYVPRRNASTPADIAVADGGPAERPRFRDQHLLYGPDGRNEALEEMLSKYEPLYSPAKRDVWESDVKETVFRHVRQLQMPTLHLARQAARQLADVYISTYLRLGTLNVNEVLDLNNIYHFVSSVNADRTAYWQKKARADLIRYAKVLTTSVVFPPTPIPVPRNRALAPYPREIERAYSEYARSLGGPLAGRRKALVALGFGIGVGGVLTCTIQVSDIVELGRGIIGVRVGGADPRTVPVRDQYRRLLLEAADLAGSGCILGFEGADSEAVSTALKPFRKITGEPLTVPKMRSTWFVRLLDGGTPIQWALEWCGKRSVRYISDLVPFSAKPDEKDAIRAAVGS
ncbi:MAG: hypothetical protein ACYDGN_09385 [Acidimicrobiales bacterium]